MEQKVMEGGKSNQKYSVLMSVYAKENAENLRKSMESIFGQTIPTDDFVLICDGPLNDELENVIKEKEETYKELLNVVRLEKNVGLGNALNAGLDYCKHDLVARMDSDDISFPERCEEELAVFWKHPEVSIVSGTVLEFVESPQKITGKRELPEVHKDICRFSKKRNPFNHPAVMFRKSSVMMAGGYSGQYPFFEDYYLWIRMLQKGSQGYNLEQPVLYMRTSKALYLRRGGIQYSKILLEFHNWLCVSGWSKRIDYVCFAVPHALVCILPNAIRRWLYGILHK